MRRINIFQLRCFKHIAETDSFSETAFELFISQSSVSKNIAKLEFDGQRTSLDDRKIFDYKSYFLSEDKYMAIFSERHPLAQKEKITWPDIREEPLIFFDRSFSLRKMLEDAFQQNKSMPNIAVECNSVDNMLELVARNAGMTLLPASISTAGYKVKAVPMEQPITRREILLVRKDTENKNAVKKLVNFILNYEVNSKTEYAVSL